MTKKLPRAVGSSSSVAAVIDQFVRTGEFPFQLDQDKGKTIGIDYVQSTISSNDHQSSSVDTYIGAEYISRPNLSILVHAQATRVIQNGILNGLPRFTSVEFPSSSTGDKTCVAARKEIIPSAGSFNTPQLLMLSGIGNKKILSHFGISTVIHNPSVGQNMSDHVLLPNSYNINSTGTVNSYPHGEGFISAVAEGEQSSTGLMTLGLGTHVAWLRLNKPDSIFTSYIDPPTGPTCGHWEIIFVNRILPAVGWEIPTGSYTSVFAKLPTPAARSNVTLKSRDPFVEPIVNRNLLGHPFDVYVMVEAIKAMCGFLTGAAFKDYLISPVSNEFASAKTDTQIEQYVRNNAGTIGRQYLARDGYGSNVCQGCVTYLFGERASALINADRIKGVY